MKYLRTDKPTCLTSQRIFESGDTGLCSESMRFRRTNDHRDHVESAAPLAISRTDANPSSVSSAPPGRGSADDNSVKNAHKLLGTDANPSSDSSSSPRRGPADDNSSSSSSAAAKRTDANPSSGSSSLAGRGSADDNSLESTDQATMSSNSVKNLCIVCKVGEAGHKCRRCEKDVHGPLNGCSVSCNDPESEMAVFCKPCKKASSSSSSSSPTRSLAGCTDHWPVDPCGYKQT